MRIMNGCITELACLVEVEWVKQNTLRWFGHVERMDEREMTKRVYMSKIVTVGVRGRPPITWDDRVLEYMNEREGVRSRGSEHARRDCKDREKWRLFCRKVKYYVA